MIQDEMDRQRVAVVDAADLHVQYRTLVMIRAEMYVSQWQAMSGTKSGRTAKIFEMLI